MIGNVFFQFIAIFNTAEPKNGVLDCQTAIIQLFFFCRLIDDEITCGNVVYLKDFSCRSVFDQKKIIFKAQAAIVNIFLRNIVAEETNERNQHFKNQKSL